MQKTVSLEIAKRLKEAGFPQDTSLWWGNETDYGGQKWLENGDETWELISDDDSVERDIAAPDVSELLEELPIPVAVLKNHVGYIVDNDTSLKKNRQEADILADALALLWLELKKTNE